MPRIAAALAIVAAAAFSIGFNIVRYPIVWEKLAASQVPAQTAGATGVSASTVTGDSSGLAVTGDTSDTDNKLAKTKRVAASISGGPATGDSDSGTSDEPAVHRRARTGRSEGSSSYGSHESDSNTHSDSRASYEDETGSDSTKPESGSGSDPWSRDSQPSEKRHKKPAKSSSDYSSDDDSDDLHNSYGMSDEDDVCKAGKSGDTDSDDATELDSTPDGRDDHQESKKLVPVGKAAKSGLAARGTRPKSGDARPARAKPKSNDKVRSLPSVDDWDPNPHADDPDNSYDSIASYPSTGIE